MTATTKTTRIKRRKKAAVVSFSSVSFTVILVVVLVARSPSGLLTCACYTKGYVDWPVVDRIITEVYISNTKSNWKCTAEAFHLRNAVVCFGENLKRFQLVSFDVNFMSKNDYEIRLKLKIEYWWIGEPVNCAFEIWIELAVHLEALGGECEMRRDFWILVGRFSMFEPSHQACWA